MKHYCNAICKFNDNAEQVCSVSIAYHVDKLCVTFRKRPVGTNYRELMRAENPRCHKTSRGYKSNSTGMVLK